MKLGCIWPYEAADAEASTEVVGCELLFYFEETHEHSQRHPQ